MNLVNLTPHPLTVAGRTIAPSGTVARAAVTYADAGDLDGIPVVAAQYGDVVDLPDATDGTVYIVSGLVRSALGDTRPDVVAPDTGPTAVRDDAGRIVGVTRLIGVAS